MKKHSNRARVKTAKTAPAQPAVAPSTKASATATAKPPRAGARRKHGTKPPASQANIAEAHTIGLDVGDRSSRLCALNAQGQVVEEGSVATTQPALRARFAHQPRTRIALEAGTHSAWMKRELEALGIEVHRGGTYVCIDGPSFSTRAESRMHRALAGGGGGADVVGMTALPEARLAREAEIAYALIALPTDYDCWRERPASSASSAPESLLAEIIGNIRKSADAAAHLIEAALRDVSMLRDRPSPAHDALRLGIWTNKDLIAPEAVERLRPIWGRHFPA